MTKERPQIGLQPCTTVPWSTSEAAATASLPALFRASSFGAAMEESQPKSWEEMAGILGLSNANTAKTLACRYRRMLKKQYPAMA